VGDRRLEVIDILGAYYERVRAVGQRRVQGAACRAPRAGRRVQGAACRAPRCARWRDLEAFEQARFDVAGETDVRHSLIRGTFDSPAGTKVDQVDGLPV